MRPFRRLLGSLRGLCSLRDLGRLPVAVLGALGHLTGVHTLRGLHALGRFSPGSGTAHAGAESPAQVTGVLLGHAVHQQGVGRVRLQIRGGEDQVLAGLFRGKGENGLPLRVVQVHLGAGGKGGGKGEFQEGLGGVCGDGVIADAGGHHKAAVELDFPVGVQTAVGAVVAGAGIDVAAPDDQVAVGVNGVSLLPQAGVDLQGAAGDGGDGDPVLVGVDAVVLGLDVEEAPLDAEMEFGVQALIVRGDGEHSGAVLLPGDHHGGGGVEGPVILCQLVLGAVLVDAGHVGAGDGVGAAVGQNHPGAGVGGVHLGGGAVGLLLGAGGHSGGRGGVVPLLPGQPGLVTFVDLVEDHRRGHRAGDVRPVQYQGDLGVRTVPGPLPQVDGQLAGVQGAGDPVDAGLLDGHHRVGLGLFRRVPVLGGALPVGLPAVVGVPVLIVEDVVGEGDRPRLRQGTAVQGGVTVGQNQGVFPLLAGGGGGAGRTCAAGAGGQRQGQGESGDPCEQLSFHSGVSFLCRARGSPVEQDSGEIRRVLCG